MSRLKLTHVLSAALGLSLLAPPALAAEDTGVDELEPAVAEGAVDVAAAGAPVSAREAWQPLLDNPGMAEFFDGIFLHLGVRVEETGEELTVHHKGDHFTLETGIDPDAVEYIVPIRLENVANLLSHGADKAVDPDEAYRILAVMFTPMTEATLAKSPVIRSKRLRRIAGVEELLHVELIAPSGEVANSHTLAFSGGQWLVIPGLYGDAERTFHMEVDAAAEYQRHIYAAMVADSGKEWRAFARWYNDWREDVSTVP
jgi:hypothetical protein